MWVLLALVMHNAAVPLFLSIIGIPMGIANLQLIPKDVAREKDKKALRECRRK